MTTRALLISLAGHAVVLASIALGAGRMSQLQPLPTRAYAVELVGMPGPPRAKKAKGQAKPSPAVPKTEVVRAKQRSGQKVDKAPSTEAMSPKGTKQPTRHTKQKPAPEVKKGEEQGGGSKTLRLEGEPFPFDEYIADLDRRLREAWEEYRPFIGGQTRVLKTTIFFTILRDGTIDECRVEVRSEVPLLDRSAHEAVLSVDPLPPLPAGYRGDQLGVYLDFEY